MIKNILGKIGRSGPGKPPIRVGSNLKPVGRVTGAKAKAGRVSPVHRIRDYAEWLIHKARRTGTGKRGRNGLAAEQPYPNLIDPVMEDRAKAGWVSPVYSKSRSMQVDMRAALENRCVGLLPDSPEAEPYKVLRTQILQRVPDRRGNTVMVTSPLPGEGKTLTAINLALTFARHYNQTSLLVDCDLRKPSIHRYLGLPGEKGLVDYLLDGVNISDLIIWPCIEKFTVISGGRPFGESGELLGSPRMKEVLAEMKGRYADRYVILDVPPILSCADAVSFAPLVDSIVVVVQSGRTPVEDVKKALDQLPKEKVLGVVINRQKITAKDYPYVAYPKRTEGRSSRQGRD